MQQPNICLVSACPIAGKSIYATLEEEGFQVEWLQDTEQALIKLRNTEYEAVVLDACLPHTNGLPFFKKICADSQKPPPTLLIAEHGSLVQLKKPDNQKVVGFSTKNIDHRALIARLREMCGTESPEHTGHIESPLGISASIRQVEEKIQTLAPYHQTPVLIVGESGVGKEVVAQRLHAIQHSSGPFIAINCAAIPESLIESELFGHEKGSFTGSENRHKGVFEQADGGTLLLDEVGEMPLQTQAKLLRAIQEKVVVRVGGEQDIPVDLRVVCATNSDLRSKVECGEFREDLFYRINVIELHIPPLREREEDILWLANQFLIEHAELYPDKAKKLDESANQALLEYAWIGNVRELKNAIERACIMTPSLTISAEDIFPGQPAFNKADANPTLKHFLQARERIFIGLTLEANSGSIMGTASTLGISRKTLWEKMKKYDIHK